MADSQAGQVCRWSYFNSSEEERIAPTRFITACIGLERGGNFCRAQVLASRAIVFFKAADLKLQLKACRRPKRLHIHQVVVASEDGERIGPTSQILQNAPDILRRRRER
jgi:hypothetical protein